jgi:hypothetical protein
MMLIMSQLTAFKRILAGPFYGLLMLLGLAVYSLTKRTPGFAYQSMIRLFCLTRGRSNDWLSSAIGFVKRRYHTIGSHGLLGEISDPVARREIVATLRRRGYYLFKERLSNEVCDRLLAYATTQSCNMCPTDSGGGDGRSEAVYRRGSPEAVRYDFKPADLLEHPDVQRLLADLSFASLAQDYLGSRPLIDVLTMWWSTDFSDRPESKAAQYFHFDMDRPKWLKFFIYLTDVELDNGPHGFVSGSQRTGAIPQGILDKGYARLTDEEVKAAFGEQAITTIVAPRGTILVEDTRGLHKGNLVLKGDRLMFQIQYSNSLFGATYAKTALRGPIIPELEDRIRAFPDIYSAYL